MKGKYTETKNDGPKYAHIKYLEHVQALWSQKSNGLKGQLNLVAQRQKSIGQF